MRHQEGHRRTSGSQFERRLRGNGRNDRSVFFGILANFLCALVIVALGSWTKHRAEGQPWPLWIRLLGLHQFQILISFSVIVLGALAFWAKRLNQLLYGCVEIFFSGVSAWVLVPGIFDSSALWPHAIGLTGAIFIAARGLGNISEARSRRAKRFSEILPDAL